MNVNRAVRYVLNGRSTGPYGTIRHGDAEDSEFRQPALGNLLSFRLLIHRESAVTVTAERICPNASYPNQLLC